MHATGAAGFLYVEAGITEAVSVTIGDYIDPLLAVIPTTITDCK